MIIKKISAFILIFVLAFADVNLMFAGELQTGEEQITASEEEQTEEETAGEEVSSEEEAELEMAEEEKAEENTSADENSENEEDTAESGSYGDESKNIEEESLQYSDEETAEAETEVIAKAAEADSETEDTTESAENSEDEEDSDIIYIDSPFEYDLSWKGSTITYADLASSSASDEDFSYASMLSDSEQKIYDAIESKLSSSSILSGITEKTFSFSNGVSFKTPMLQVDISTSSIGVNMTVDSAGSYMDTISNAGLAYVYDNPEDIWICNFTANISSSGRRVSTIHYYFLSTSDYSTVSSDISSFDSWANNVLTNAASYSANYYKLKYMHDAVCNQTSYNYSSLTLYFGDEAFRYAHAASGIVALDNQVVCEGYAKVYKILCDEADIPCLLITSTDHMWNVVQMEDGEWYGVDCTWDDGSSISHDYFLKGTAVFEDHSYTNPFTFDLAYDDYTYLGSNYIVTTEAETETTTQEGYIAPPSFTVKGVFGGRSVTFSSITEGALIFYSSESSSLTTADTWISNGGTVLFEDFYGTVYARTYYRGKWSNVSRLILKIPVANTPTITVSGSEAEIACTTPSSFICYTADGTDPVVETDGTLTNGTWLKVNGSRTNSGTINAAPGSEIRAIAVRSCFTTSSAASAYTAVSPPSFTVVGAFGGRNVTFSSNTEDVVIYYSSESSTLTEEDACVSNGETILFEDFYGTIYARACYNGMWSNVSRLILKIPVVNTPTITANGNSVTIKCTTPSSFICYTTDGSEPVVSADGTVINGTWLRVNGSRTSSGTITAASGQTIKAIAVRSCFTTSETASLTI